MRRRFNTRERVALYLAADGRCESCGTELQPGWHADHVYPFTAGGLTDVVNGSALCPSCNLQKGDTMNDPRDRWQRDAVSAFLASDYDFLVTACPGAGKTRMALEAARRMMDAGDIDRLIVIAPTKAVRDQWKSVAASMGVDLTATFKNGDGAIPSDAAGAVAVYAQIAAAPHIWRILASRYHRTLVVFDEIHHCADEDSTSWGPAIAEAFGQAHRRLLLSGTPFRTDGTRIPFVTYDDNGMSISHHGLSYGEAVKLGIVRPCRFEVMDGSGEWMRGATRTAAQAATVNDADQAALLTSLYAPDGQWMTSVMRAADTELTRLREELPTAGGLVIAESRAQARAYAALMSAICGEVVPFVVSDDESDPAQVIATYREADTRWIVAVDLISEGVDIPRLSAVLFASRKKTEMWFRQIVGRVVRRDADDLTATAFIPALPVLVELAQRIEDEARAALVEAELAVRERMRNEQRELEFDVVHPIGSSEAVLDSVITSGQTVDDAELRRAIEVRDAIGASLANAHPADIAQALRMVSAPPVATARVTPLPNASTGDELRGILRKRVGAEVNRRAQAHDVHPGSIHRHLNDLCGDTVPTASVASLEKRLGMLSEWP